ncbi:large conductance mechanosensitive channel protein MscL [Azospirillum sp. YIM DDC1]|uniref:Large-conductance mechanosensitive channel n=1 Tax=Azospirillum aestuarii TaxID=2802052 RepID=A0ABS1HX42_9PROT|nr:large conductance mechanosensitive channel protein MscL [Azospirillum aestuarii]MBK3777811.1 large conductance mechanosensitive channel protein MscL [Azospirillum brasilense]MBK4719390.1 large conductance mechanosensitive channel protein MscL [Azospirillum aestuarii]TWA90879.1 large conductance mechanosensitive channel [Azospirillum brasilense]
MLQEFKTFISRGNVVELAVGIIIGAAFTGIVNSLVRDMLMPPIGWVMGGIDFSNYFLNLSGGHYESLAAAEAAGVATINYGRFINALINFFIVAGALFLIVRQVNRLHFLHDSKPKAPPRQEILLEEIRDALRARQATASGDPTRPGA